MNFTLYFSLIKKFYHFKELAKVRIYLDILCIIFYLHFLKERMNFSRLFIFLIFPTNPLKKL